MIVQELHKIQHEHRYLPAGELRALSERIGVPLCRLHEVASYFPHFRTSPAPAAEVRVCRDMACYLHGAAACKQRLATLAGEIGGGQVEVEGASCLGRCDGAPAVMVNDVVYFDKSQAELESIVRAAAAGMPLPTPVTDISPLGFKIDVYNGKPNYNCIRNFVEEWKKSTEPDPIKRRKILSDPILKSLEIANLRGMGGAGFPTVRKWTTVRDAPIYPKYTVCNGDESEPGTFKDREILRRAPWLVIEGISMAALNVGAEKGYIFIRHEYQDEIAAVRKALAEAQTMGVSGRKLLGSDLNIELEVFVSPGGYICGEETALLEAIEDRRAEPRNKPPLMSLEGLFGKPTSMNNVETFSWVPSILTNGGEWYRNSGTNGGTGMRLVSISGDVARPGVYEVPIGQKVRELIFDCAGGMRDGQKLQAICTSGPSGGFLPPTLETAKQPGAFTKTLVERGIIKADDKTIDMLEVPLDFDVFKPFPDFMLGAAFVVYGDQANLMEAALNCTEFFCNESCGKCVPCRMGSQKTVDILTGLIQGRGKAETGAGELATVKDLSNMMLEAAICGLGWVVSSSIRTMLKHFPNEVLKYANALPPEEKAGHHH
ncbi:MAG TPA: NAD(P)H-dependent oxidoreductase subunit E [Pirellulales bacterium]|jgi:NADH:ubiquinone oxidoreductase subunit F (NADH-binding)/NADH:ubiquinone oxidoreductase subunit E